MKLEKQVVSLRLAKKLKKLGVKQESSFYWYELGFYVDGKIKHRKTELQYEAERLFESEQTPWQLVGERYSAFTVAELISRLGDKFGVLNSFKDGTFGAYIPNDCGVNGLGDTPQEALANLLLESKE